jgi:hypothetical protein
MKTVYAIKNGGSDCEMGVVVRVMGRDLVCYADGVIAALDSRWHESKEAALAAATQEAEYQRLFSEPGDFANWLRQLRQQPPEVAKAMRAKLLRFREISEPPGAAISAAYGWRDGRWVGPPKSVVRAMEVVTDGKWRWLSPSEERKYFID